MVKAEGVRLNRVGFGVYKICNKSYFHAFSCVWTHTQVPEALPSVARGTWTAENHCVVFALRVCDEDQIDDEEEILEDKRQVLALQ